MGPQALHVPALCGVQFSAVRLGLADVLCAEPGLGAVREVLLLDLPAPDVEVGEQGQLEGTVGGFGEDLLVVGEQVVEAGGGEDGVRSAGLAGGVGGRGRVEGGGAGFFEAGAGFESAAEGGGGG